MKTKKTDLMELLQMEGKIWVNIKPIQRHKFLKFAKSCEFKWFTGKEISLDEYCWLVVAMFNDMTIANIPAMHRVFGEDRNIVYKVDFCNIARNELTCSV